MFCYTALQLHLLSLKECSSVARHYHSTRFQDGDSQNSLEFRVKSYPRPWAVHHRCKANTHYNWQRNNVYAHSFKWLTHKVFNELKFTIICTQCVIKLDWSIYRKYLCDIYLYEFSVRTKKDYPLILTFKKTTNYHIFCKHLKSFVTLHV